ncbi:MAG: helix-turn-helix domain-containing protein [Planctomycetales bacterium]
MKRPATDRHREFSGTCSIGTAARRLKIPKKHLRQLLASEQLEFVQICGQIRVPEKVVERARQMTWDSLR